MKKVFAGVLCAAMLVSSLGMSAFADETEAAGSGLATEGKLVVGFDAEYPPYGYMDDDGNYTGFDLELAAAVCELEGWELVATPIDWDSKDMELDSGNIDCIWNGFTMNGREDSYTFSVPYVDNSQVIVTSEDAGISTLEDLEGKIVGVQADSAALALLDEGGDQEELGATFAEMQQFADYNTAFAELQAGSLDAVAIDIGVANYQIAGREGYVILDEYLNSEQYAVGFKKGNDALCGIINADLETMLKDGTFDEIAAEYEELGIEPEMLCLAESLGLESETEAE
jgi:polar amino acid transport system substrate-binding protein